MSTITTKTLYAMLAWCFLFNLSTNAQQLSVAINTTPACHEDGTASAVVTGGVPPYTYNWYAFGSNNNNASTQTIVGVKAGAYVQVSVKDANNTVGYGYAVIERPFDHNATVVHGSCPGSNSSININTSGGTGPFSFNWSNGAATQQISNISGGHYIVTVTDANGCFIVDDSLYVYPQTTMSVYIDSTTSELCAQKNGGARAVVIGGTPPYTYLWNNGATTPNLSGVSAGQYSVTVSDVNNCSPYPAYTYIEQLSSMQISFSTISERCSHDGSAVALPSNGTPPYTYLWDNGATDAGISNLTAGSYGVSITDNVACTSFNKCYIETINTIQTTEAKNPEHCSDKDGNITMSASGGLSPYNYIWSNGSQGAAITGLHSGHYYYTVTDANGCKRIGFVYVENISTINLNTTYTESACHDGSITVNASGGVSPYSYYWNTSPVQSGKTAVGLDPGYYNVVVTDKTGCTNETTRYVPASSLLTAYMSTTDEHCHDANGTATITSVIGGTPPYTYKWNHSTAQTGMSVSGLDYGGYFVVITDNSGCDKTLYYNIYSHSPVKAALSYTSPSCNNPDGSATATPSGGTPPYRYQWSNGATTQTISNIREDYYSVYVADSKDCDFSDYIFVAEPANCNITITGTVFNDENADCAVNNADEGLPIVLVGMNNGAYTFTDWGGNYYFGGKANKTYTIFEQEPNYFNQVCPAAPGFIVTTSAPGTVSADNNFFVTAHKDTNDLGVGIYNYQGALRPGFEHTYYLYYYNGGNTRLSGNVSFVHDTAVTFLGSDPMPNNYDVATRTASYSFANLSRNGGYITVFVKTYTTIPLGANACFDASITPVTNDFVPADNNYQYCQEVSGAYDPNAIEVRPEGIGADGFISPKDSVLDYTIHFQNTGTDTAFTVVIVDTLDSHLNLNTLKKGAASHNCQIDVKPGNILTATFKNILLPDSNINEKKSHGFVNFSLHVNPDLPSGTKIRGTGHIYFDYNVPVVTNNAFNTILITGVNNKRPSEQSVLVYPNPMGQFATVKIKNYNSNKFYRFTMYDLTGREIKRMNQLNSESFIIEKGDLPEGMYFYKLESGKEVLSSGKIVIQ